MPDVTVELSEKTLATLETRAEAKHGGDRDEAVEALLAMWLHRQR